MNKLSETNELAWDMIRRRFSDTISRPDTRIASLTIMELNVNKSGHVGRLVSNDG